MILSVYLTDYWLSAVLIQTDPPKVLDTTFVKFEYEPNKLTRQLTQKKLSGLLHQKFQPKDNVPVIITSSSSSIGNIKVDYPLDNIKSQAPIACIILDHYSSDPANWLEPNKINTYLNRREYRLNIDFDIKKRHDLWALQKHLQENIGEFLKIEQVVIGSCDVPEDSRADYTIKLITRFADSSKIAGVWKFYIDNNFSIVPIISGLMHEHIDLAAFFADTPLEADVKLIKAPGVTEINYNGKTKTFDKNKINLIELAIDKKVPLNWKTSKSKFNGEIYGSKLGIFFDNRIINE